MELAIWQDICIDYDDFQYNYVQLAEPVSNPIGDKVSRDCHSMKSVCHQVLVWVTSLNPEGKIQSHNFFHS